MSTRAKPMPLPDDEGAHALPSGFLPGRYDPCGIGLVILAIEHPRVSAAWSELPVLLDHLFTEGITCVVVTRAPRDELAEALSRLDCDARLPMRVCREDCQAGMGLEAVLLACNRLAVAAKHAVIIADGPSGAANASAAGGTVIGLGGAVVHADLRRSGAHATVDRLGRLVPLSRWAGLDGQRI